MNEYRVAFFLAHSVQGFMKSFGNFSYNAINGQTDRQM